MSGKGSINLQDVVSSVVGAGLPTIQVHRPGEARLSGSEFIALTPQLVEWFSSGEINIDETTLNRFHPVSYSELTKYDFAIRMPVGVTGSGLVFCTPKAEISVTFPPIDTLEERLERAAIFRKVNEFIEPFSDDEIPDY